MRTGLFFLVSEKQNRPCQTHSAFHPRDNLQCVENLASSYVELISFNVFRIVITNCTPTHRETFQVQSKSPIVVDLSAPSLTNVNNLAFFISDQISNDLFLWFYYRSCIGCKNCARITCYLTVVLKLNFYVKKVLKNEYLKVDCSKF